MDPQSPDRINLSCNIMRQFYLETTAPYIQYGHFIENVCISPGVVNLLRSTKLLFQYLSVDGILIEGSWVTTRFDSNLRGPSEKQYQFQFYGILFKMCRFDWLPTLEVQISKNTKVDLALLNTEEMKKYLIEIGCNCRNTGDSGHSAEGLYERQVKKYHEGSTASIVVMIYNYKRNDYWWPKKNEPNITYIVVEHLLTNPQEIIIYTIQEDTGERIVINKY